MGDHLDAQIDMLDRQIDVLTARIERLYGVWPASAAEIDRALIQRAALIDQRLAFREARRLEERARLSQGLLRGRTGAMTESGRYESARPTKPTRLVVLPASGL